jgi:hypothetical protein
MTDEPEERSNEHTDAPPPGEEARPDFDESSAYTAEEEAVVAKRLEDLGYL